MARQNNHPSKVAGPLQSQAMQKMVKKWAAAFNIEFEDEPGFDMGNELTVVTAIRVNDIVVFEPAGPGQIEMRALAPGEVEGYSGQLYRAGKGKEPGSVRMTAL